MIMIMLMMLSIMIIMIVICTYYTFLITVEPRYKEVGYNKTLL